jgi:hypothetical protein
MPSIDRDDLDATGARGRQRIRGGGASGHGRLFGALRRLHVSSNGGRGRRDVYVNGSDRC